MGRTAFDALDRHLPDVRAAVRAHVAKRMDEGATIVSARTGNVIATRKEDGQLQEKVVGTYPPFPPQPGQGDAPIRIKLRK